MEQQLNDDDFDHGNFQTDLISSLFGHQISPSNPNTNSQNPTTCPHPILIKNTCTKCNTTILDGNPKFTTIPFWYVYPSMSISHGEMNRAKGTNLQALLVKRKLHLVLDLDHTLVHTRVNWKLTPEDRKFLRTKRHGVNYYNLAEEGGSLYKMAGGWTKLRPYVRSFLREASTMFEMTVYTLGCRACAWATAKVLDPEGEYFGMWRVITREDCSGGGLDKHKKVLDMVVAHERGVLVVDDNEGVWGDHKSSLIKIKPYNYFSYNSPDEDKVHDSSPPRKSWSQLGGDESEERGELARTLREVHRAFFDGLEEEYEKRDVREVLQRVLKAQKSSNKLKGKKEINKKKKNS
ncbi:LOW QUALITY PROTEIN: hypothetical protein Cgig2_013981 [Carnegiea gigantea]|uniref:RNA polymerase II C-terminal domain phosphatase-like n=1 Tax=Carnegiea gigantea TaxID=171969 RepID=A0A9Q1KYH0_9CARY|nr:LOW QUALITY PROTEIN: hypothetical protein Cgig2_013981 [Carnegiea gigantea]